MFFQFSAAFPLATVQEVHSVHSDCYLQGQQYHQTEQTQLQLAEVCNEDTVRHDK